MPTLITTAASSVGVIPAPVQGGGTDAISPTFRRRCILAAVWLASLLLVACGGSSSTESVTAPTTDPAEANEPETASESPTEAAPAPTAAPAVAVDAEPPRVAVTTNILADVTIAIGGEDIEVLDLMPRGADPHSFALSAAEVNEVLNSELIIVSGLGLEEGIVSVFALAEEEGVPLLEIGPGVDPIDYATGDQPDPHYWTDPNRMATAVELITDELAALTGDAATERTRARSDDYLDDLGELDAEIVAAVEGLDPERRRLVTNHHVLGYFADRYDFEVLGAVLPSGTTLASPSSADLAGLSEVIISSGVPAIFAETSQPDRLIEVLRSEVGIDITIASLYSESLSEPGGEAGTYLDMMRYNATTIIDALSSPAG